MIELYEFIETEFKRLIGKQIKNGKSDKYKFVRATERYGYTRARIMDGRVGHGPAHVFVNDVRRMVELNGRRYGTVFSMDLVHCWR